MRSGGSEFLVQIRHFDRGDGGVRAAVARLGAGALDGLFDVFHGDDAVDDGDAGLHADLGEGFRDLAVNGGGVRGGALDDHAERDHGVVVAALRELGDRERELEGPGHPRLGDVRAGASVADDRVDRAAEELGDEEFVETSADDRDFEPGGVEVAFQYGEFVVGQGGFS